MNNYTGRSTQILLLSHISERGIRHFLSSISGLAKKKIYLATIELDGMSSVRCGPCGDPCSWEVGEADSTAPFWLHVYVGYHKFYSWCNEDVPWFMLARQHRPQSRNFICSVVLFKRDAETSSWLNPVALQSLWANESSTHHSPHVYR